MRGLTYIAVGTLLAGSLLPEAFTQAPSDAPSAFQPGTMTLVTNGFVDQATFDADKAVFEEQESRSEGLGPVYNAQSCAECHQNPVTGGISQVTELRAGHFDGVNFTDHTGGSLINDRAINPAFQERVLGAFEVRTFRTSLNTLGDGFVEAIDSNTLNGIANNQPSAMRGQFIQVPVNEANNALRGARFGWKNQHASLESFSADAYLNEMGITSPLQAVENTADGQSVAVCDTARDPEDDGSDVRAFANFMRATKVPPRGPISDTDNRAGLEVFTRIGCATCHVPTITTAAAGTPINGGAFVIPPALGNK